VFGARHLSWQCFRRSVVYSLCVVTIIFVIWAALFPGVLGRVTRGATHPARAYGLLLILSILTFGINVLPDYVSLLQTRWILQVMTRTRNVVVTIGLLLANLAAAATISGLSVLLSIAILERLFGGDGLERLARSCLAGQSICGLGLLRQVLLLDLNDWTLPE